MEIKTGAECLGAEKKAWTMNGNSGVTYKVGFRIQGEKWYLRMSEETDAAVAELNALKGTEGELTFDLNDTRFGLKTGFQDFEPSDE